jgi:hypothetical protein
MEPSVVVVDHHPGGGPGVGVGRPLGAQLRRDTAVGDVHHEPEAVRGVVGGPDEVFAVVGGDHGEVRNRIAVRTARTVRQPQADSREHPVRTAVQTGLDAAEEDLGQDLRMGPSRSGTTTI